MNADEARKLTKEYWKKMNESPEVSTLLERVLIMCVNACRVGASSVNLIIHNEEFDKNVVDIVSKKLKKDYKYHVIVDTEGRIASCSLIVRW